VRANPVGILLMLQRATAALSAVLNNVSTVLLMARYLAYGAPLTLVSIAICRVYVWLRYF
jgi:Na+/H+ antiporter NhaD/arsenite permease-like protein